MKEIKITNYTTKDWLKQIAVGFCIISLGNFAIRSFIDDKDYIDGVVGIVGVVGWFFVYNFINKDIQKRNPQD
jgi:hypothetical protein